MDRQHLLGQIRSSASLPELLAHEENCRSRLTVQVESMYKMQKTFHRDQQSHVSHLRKQRESPHYQHVRRRPLSRHFGGLGGQLQSAHAAGKLLSAGAAAGSGAGDNTNKERSTPGPTQKGYAGEANPSLRPVRLEILEIFTKRRLGYLSLSFMYFTTCGRVCLQSLNIASLVYTLFTRGGWALPRPPIDCP